MTKTVLSYLKNSVNKYGDKYVCIDDNESVTYNELDQMSDIVAVYLSKRVEVASPVPVIMKKSCRALFIMWGIIKAGGCYVFIDSNQPPKRIETILSVLKTPFVIAEKEALRKLKEIEIEIVSPEQLMEVEVSNEEIGKLGELQETFVDTNPLYVMFTSGSTGVPKGVLVNHRSVIDFIDCFTEIFGIDETDVLGNQAPWDFDVSVKDIFSCIKCGATLRLIPKKYFSLPIDLVKLLDEDKVTNLTWAASALSIVSSRGAFDVTVPKYIKRIMYSGEVLPIKQYNIWRKMYPNALIANVYGPTEITCNCTYFITNGIYEENSVIPIGKAFPNEKVFLLSDEDKLITPDDKNIEGEICVSGTCVTMGYFRNSEETSKRFVNNPLNKSFEERIYRTGDLAYYDENENLVFASRKDFQIKHMGHRIELSEVEKCINACDNVNLSCCLYEDEVITAFVEASSDVTEKEIVTSMRKTVPQFMIPAQFIFLDKMPFNNNGKIDRNALKLLL